MSSSDPEAVALWEKICADQENAKGDWTGRLRAAGVKLAHPDDGWVKRDRNSFSLSWYPQFDDHPEEGDLIAFGRPPQGEQYYRAGPNPGPECAYEGYRICRVTKVVRRTSILGYFQDFAYEDTGVRLPPRRPTPVSRLRRLFRRSS